MLVIKQQNQGWDLSWHQRQLMQTNSDERENSASKKSNCFTINSSEMICCWRLSSVPYVALVFFWLCFVQVAVSAIVWIVYCIIFSPVLLVFPEQYAVVGGVLHVQSMSLWKMRDESLPLWAMMTNHFSLGSNDMVKLPQLGTQGIITSSALCWLYRV